MKKINFYIGLLINSLWAIVLFSSTVRGEDALKWKFKAGETLNYTYQLTSKAEILATGVVQAGPKKCSMDISMNLTWSVDRVGVDGTAEITQKIRRIRLSFSTEYESGLRDQANYDSGDRSTINNAWSGMMDTGISPLVGEPFALKLDTRGRLIAIKLPERAEKAWRADPAGIAGVDHPFSPVFSAEGFGLLLAPVMPELSGEPLGKGGTWRYSWGGPAGRLGLIDSYTAAGAEGEVVKFIAITEATLSDAEEVSVLSSPPPLIPPLTISSTAAVKFDKGRLERRSGKATLSFDPEAGHLISSTRDLAYRISSGYQLKEGDPKGGDLSSSFHLSSSLKLVLQFR